MKTSKILLTFFISLFSLFLTTKCYSQNNNHKTEDSFSLEFLQECGFKDYRKTISIENDGSIKYKVIGVVEKVIRAVAEDRLSESELNDLKQTILNNNFFDFKKDLSVEKCYDAPSYDLKIKIDDKYNQSGGYCVKNDSFLNIVDKLDKLANSINK